MKVSVTTYEPVAPSPTIGLELTLVEAQFIAACVGIVSQERIVGKDLPKGNNIYSDLHDTLVSLGSDPYHYSKMVRAWLETE